MKLLKSHPPGLATSLVMLLALLTPWGCSKSGSKSPTAPGGTGNHAPTVYVTVDSTRMSIGHTASVHVTANDVDGDQLTFSYSATGGTIAASGPTATVATFTASTKGNASISVSVSDGNGGTTTASAGLYLVFAGPPSGAFTRYTCSITWAPGESLVVLGGSFEESSGASHSMEGSVPYIITGGTTRFSADGSAGGTSCPFTAYLFRLTVQRPLPDGRTYDLTFR